MYGKNCPFPLFNLLAEGFIIYSRGGAVPVGISGCWFFIHSSHPVRNVPPLCQSSALFHLWSWDSYPFLQMENRGTEKPTDAIKVSSLVKNPAFVASGGDVSSPWWPAGVSSATIYLCPCSVFMAFFSFGGSSLWLQRPRYLNLRVPASLIFPRTSHRRVCGWVEGAGLLGALRESGGDSFTRTAGRVSPQTEGKVANKGNTQGDAGTFASKRRHWRWVLAPRNL